MTAPKASPAANFDSLVLDAQDCYGHILSNLVRFDYFEYGKNAERPNEFTDSEKSLSEHLFGPQKVECNLQPNSPAERITLERRLCESSKAKLC